MTYKVNGTELLIQPTNSRWLARESLARDGAGHNVYPGVYQFEMTFQLEFTSGTSQLQDFLRCCCGNWNCCCRFTEIQLSNL